MQKEGRPCGRPSRSASCPLAYGVSLLIRVDQLASAVRGPGVSAVPGAVPGNVNVPPAQVPSRLSPLPSAKNGPPHGVYSQEPPMYSLAIQIDFPSTAAAP